MNRKGGLIVFIVFMVFGLAQFYMSKDINMLSNLVYGLLAGIGLGIYFTFKK